ncbi:MAG: nucleotidyltransferase family protein [Parcubacteria group bacterium]
MDINIEKIEPILKEYGVKYAGIFGSHARGEAKPNSDIDILIKLVNPIGLPAFIRLERKLSEVLGKKVDLVSEGGLSPYLREPVLNDLQVVYGQR